ncbi:MoaD/ThiS family protein [Williamsia sp. CHRR-6]|nr:MoaD/ThiS family protein [Williamsia sp. CHRR-6]
MTVRYFAAARAAAGRGEQSLTVPATATIGDLEAQIGMDNPALARVLQRCTYLRDAVAVRDRAVPVAPCTTIDVLPPFAGG